MLRMNRCWRSCQWLALGVFTAALAGCAPTTERESADPALISAATPSLPSANAAAPAKRVATTELGVDGYDLSSRVTGAPVEEIEPEIVRPLPDNYISSHYKDRGLGVKTVRPPVAAKVDADDPDKYELKAPSRDSDQQGQASWYGEQFHGKRTASGERFDLNELTAAHKTLPFGTKVCVRSAVTGKSVVVRINDRGPFAPGRVIDLSKAAAQELGMVGLGIKPVEIWRLAKNEGACPDVDTASARLGKQTAESRKSKVEKHMVSAKSHGRAHSKRR
nr:septal ring lytic transglycosylase RlpA family protein [Comamonas testosteroni]